MSTTPTPTVCMGPSYSGTRAPESVPTTQIPEPVAMSWGDMFTRCTVPLFRNTTVGENARGPGRELHDSFARLAR